MKKDIRLKLTAMWLHAMDPRTALPGSVRAHIEHILGNEYRLTPPIEATRTERAAHDQQAA